ncbi:hypothetical protein LINGRAHAP2_LOCUS11154 [Linum grandiflorum]
MQRPPCSRRLQDPARMRRISARRARSRHTRCKCMSPYNHRTCGIGGVPSQSWHLRHCLLRRCCLLASSSSFSCSCSLR